MSGGDAVTATARPPPLPAEAEGGYSGNGDTGNASDEAMIVIVACDVVDRGDGTYDCGFRPERAGTWAVEATVGGTPLAAGPTTVLVAPGVATRKCSVARVRGGLPSRAGRGDGELRIAVFPPGGDGGGDDNEADGAAMVVVSLRDERGNTAALPAAPTVPDCDPSTSFLRARLVPSAGCGCGDAGTGADVEVALATSAPGTVAGRLRPTAPGRWLLEIEWRDERDAERWRSLPGTPLSVLAVAATAAGVGTGVEAVAPVAADAEAATEAPVVDLSARWARAAREAYTAVDGADDGFTSDDDDLCPSDVAGARADIARGIDPRIRVAARAASRAQPGVPVVENLEDMWRVQRLTDERKGREEAERRREAANAAARAAARREAVRASLVGKYGPF